MLFTLCLSKAISSVSMYHLLSHRVYGNKLKTTCVLHCHKLFTLVLLKSDYINVFGSTSRGAKIDSEGVELIMTCLFVF
jgi:hypothetical protein